jgi:hypothetical protein
VKIYTKLCRIVQYVYVCSKDCRRSSLNGINKNLVERMHLVKNYGLGDCLLGYSPGAVFHPHHAVIPVLLGVESAE